MHEGKDILESAVGTADPVEVYTVTRKAHGYFERQNRAYARIASNY